MANWTVSRIEGRLRTHSRVFILDELSNGSLKILARSGYIQELLHWRSWPMGLSRIDSRLRTHSKTYKRAFKLEELANWTLKN
jgi:hypothetical protein